MDQLTDLERLVKLVAYVADDGPASDCKTVAEYRDRVLAAAVGLLGYTPDFLQGRRKPVRRREVPLVGRCRDDARRVRRYD